MISTLKINRYQAKFSPAQEFDDPKDLLKEVMLTRGEKLTALRSWAFEVHQRLEAVDEGMIPDPSTMEMVKAMSSDEELLHKVKLAIAELKSSRSQSMLG